MNKTSCTYEKVTLRTLGFVLLPFVLFFAAVAGIVVPVFGVIFALPLLLLIGLFIAAPRSKTCKLLFSNTD
ncbi:hypothetical protein D3OALGA1CA_1316 [Olavius algarvensis associated proteobacterium Delta 3]|nr:hypothetical protein D3OALGB2SA_612 [Olavius algarvensis associated proteobacterium Delta 3]CAB5099088.1 hypothetical protein D3OALGA1CA_1316 [Olavius algarvensis associated proteobacterium Delta 3]